MTISDVGGFLGEREGGDGFPPSLSSGGTMQQPGYQVRDNILMLR